ncbi:hypothetical protein NRB56_59840 [Nocardia sp. RB56]|uniref:Copper resistance protein D domain-containing protein n=1 Tax=Nocardia aurantia TaxID=2585199 RepID=A0A7K0DYJ6_9NOCA|nr:hypothetical protein [Nocardia aurantia]
MLAVAAPPAPGVGRVVVEAGYYVGLAVAVGVGSTVAWLAPAESTGGVVAGRVRRLGVPAAILVAVTTLLEFFSEVARAEKTGFRAAFGRAVVERYLHAPATRGSSVGAGAVASTQLGACLALVLALLATAVWGARAWGWAVVLFGIVTVGVPAVTFGPVHTASTVRAVLTVAHLAGALVWAGGLLVLAFAGLMGRFGAGDSSGRVAEDWGRIWVRFGSVALGVVGVLVVSGSWLAWTHVGTPAQLFTTPYGRYLAIKLALVVVMLGAGGYNARVLLPGIEAARASGDQAGLFRVAVRHFPKVVAVEAVLAVGVLFVVPFLAGSARSEAGWPAARSFDLTVFGTGVVLAVIVAGVLWAGTRTGPRGSADAREAVRAA